MCDFPVEVFIKQPKEMSAIGIKSMPASDISLVEARLPQWKPGFYKGASIKRCAKNHLLSVIMCMSSKEARADFPL